MAYDGRKITGEVSIYDVQRATGNYSARDVGNLCLGRNINKWSKHKPVDRAKLTPLADGDAVGGFRGRGIGGEYYGLICSTAEFTLSVALHEVAFTYIGPKGGISSPYRLSDFSGYDSLAEPDPTGKINADEVYWKDEITSGRTLAVNIYHREWVSDTGVNLNDIISSADGFGDVKENMYGCYPLIMIGNKIRCLQNEKKPVIGIGHQGEYQCTTFGTKNNDGTTTWWNDWVVPLDLLGTIEPGTYKATVMFFYPKPNDTFAANLIAKCKAGWENVEEYNEQTVRAFPVPKAIGVEIKLKRHVGPTVDVTILKTGVQAEVRWPAASYYDDGAINAGDIYHITVRVSGSPNPDITISGGSFAVDLEAPEKTGAGSSNVLTRTWNQLGFIGVPGQTVYFTWTASHNNIQLEGGSGSASVPNT